MCAFNRPRRRNGIDNHMNKPKDSLHRDPVEYRIHAAEPRTRTRTKRRGVQVIYGRGFFEDSRTLRVETGQGQQFVKFEHAIIAVGSKSAMPKAFDLGNPRIMTSREALEIEEVPENLLVVGGGYIGMELGTVYAALGSRVVVVEALDSILTGGDPDLIRPVMARAQKVFKEIRVRT